MHLATYSKEDAGAMLAHYDRSIGPRDHIDRDGIVYNLAPKFDGGPQARFRTLCEGLEIGAKTKPLADWVITKPAGFGGDAGEFFAAVYGFMAGIVGEERIVGAYVHMDEPGAEPHMHFALVPIVETEVMTNDKSQPLRWTEEDQRKNPEHVAGEIKEDSKGTKRYKRVPLLDADGNPVMRRTATASKLFTRKDMAGMHEAIENHLCRELGVEHVGMKLDEKDREQKAKAKLSKLDHEDYVEVTAEIERANGELAELTARKECLRQEVEELEPAAVGIAESAGALVSHIGDAGREREVGSRVEELERQVREARGRAVELEREVRELDHEVGGLERAVSAAEETVRALVGRVRGFLRGIPEHLADLAASFGLREPEEPRGMPEAGAPAPRYNLRSEVETAREASPLTAGRGGVAERER